MANLWGLLTNHASEVYDTLSQGKVGQDLRADASKIKTGSLARMEQLANMSPQEAAMNFGPMGIPGTLKHVGATTYSDLLANIAKKDLLEGRLPEEVWHKTGYHPLGSIFDANYTLTDFPAGIQGEIADTGTSFNVSKLKPLLKHVNTTGLPEQIEMSSVIKHPELFKNYPSLKQEPLTFLPKTIDKNASNAWYQPALNRGEGRIFIRDKRGAGPQYEAFLHELDHKLMFEAPESAGLYGLTNLYAAPKTNLDYLLLPHESTARMREARYLGKNKDNSNPPYINKSDLKNSPFFDLAIQRYGAWPKELAPWLSREQRQQADHLPRSLGNLYSTDWLNNKFFGAR